MLILVCYLYEKSGIQFSQKDVCEKFYTLCRNQGETRVVQPRQRVHKLPVQPCQATTALRPFHLRTPSHSKKVKERFGSYGLYRFLFTILEIKTEKFLKYFVNFFLFKDFIYLFLDRGNEGEKEGEEYQYFVASYAPRTGDLAHNPGMCPDQESNHLPFGSHQPSIH